MTIQTLKYSTLILASLTALAGCPSDDTGGNNSDTDPTSGPSSSSPPTTTMSTSASTSGMTDSMTGDSETTTMGMTDTDTSGTTEVPDPFIFRDDDPSAYTQVDRMGLPAVNTALNIVGDKDLYNANSPVNDLAGEWLAEFRGSINTLHLGSEAAAMQTDANGLNDDLAGAFGQTVAEVSCNPNTGGDPDDCIAQIDVAAPYSEGGDVLAFDTAVDMQFPNGRHPANAVIDLELALVLLNLGPPFGAGTHAITDFYDLPLNPTANAEGFVDAFPYLNVPN